MKRTALFATLFLTLSGAVIGQVIYKGVTKISLQQGSININGLWNNADHTGNATMDRLLDKLVAGVKTNIKAVKALEATAAEIKKDPQRFINDDGSVNKEALIDIVKQKFATAGEVSVPTVQLIQQEEGDLR